ncbi:MAG TPA: preprotein translocase subunit SecA [Myxococcota bacterium]|nr:preprotein translocase subunit SecA [Myxococcota bacterium]
MGWILSALRGKRTRRMNRYRQRLDAINAVEPVLRNKTDGQLREMSLALRRRAGAGTRIDDLLIEAFALGREAARRTLGMRHFDVQVLGAMALHDGLIAEMKTGEGKTLAATLVVYLNALTGKGIHVVTVNDYLAERDANWMGPLYRFLGLRVGVILESMGDYPEDEIRNRKEAYACDVTYGTNHEIAFDYLRDNLAVVPEEIVQRGFQFAIVDEVDFLLIDEARTPLIISGPSRADTGLYEQVDRIVGRLEAGKHFTVEAKTRTASLTEAGFATLQRKLGVDNLADPDNLEIFHAVHQSVLAHGVYQLDVDYIVEEGQVFIVDEFTGRVSEDKRYSDGLHQAIEAKERVEVQPEDATLAKVTYQTFFGLYKKLAGMTGTAWTERKEFLQTYGRDVQVIPTHRPMIRHDYQDLVFETIDDKHRAVVDRIVELREQGRPILVGSTSVRESEKLSTRLEAANLPHSVLNAKNHHEEAAVIANAGRRGAVTISTNMAGRGTDIILGGNPKLLDDQNRAEQEEVSRAGGLHVIGTGNHESMRIDNQLRGRAGRQGDPGSSQFMVALEDEIWQKFGKLQIEVIRKKLQSENHRGGEPIPRRWVLPVLKSLQKKVDTENESVRRDVLKYDLVVHMQRETIYAWRRTLVSGERYDPQELIGDLIDDLMAQYTGPETLSGALQAHFHAPFELVPSKEQSLTEQAFEQALFLLNERETSVGPGIVHELGRRILLQSIDDLWTDHLTNLERLEDGIGLRGYAQVDPLIEWRKEATILWQELLRSIRSRAVRLWFLVEPK